VQAAEQLCSRMTLEEKIGQLCLSHNAASVEDVRAGRFGALLNVTDPARSDMLQKAAVEESRLGIPLILGRDVIHGLRTVFPIPLAQACTWDDGLIRECAAAAAKETAASGYNWTYSPMVDISRDPRWGRIAESYGEDPFLASAMARATVLGYQSPQPGLPHGLAACVKHFAAYGAAEGGRDYASTLVPPRELRDVYLPPYKAAVDAGVLTVMSAFNDIDGVPCTGSRELLTDILRREWGFEGFVVSDWKSVTELIAHGFARDPQQAAARAINAGMDMEMVSTSYRDHLETLLGQGLVDMATIDNSVKAILRVKFIMGLFENPYRPEGLESSILGEEHLALARRAARESVVMLKNAALPLSETARILVCGPLADAPLEQLGTWAPDGREGDSVTPLAAMRERFANVAYAPGLAYSRDRSEALIAQAAAAAQDADVVVLFAGEEAMLSGEAHSRADIRLPGAQESLVHALAATGKPVVLVLMTGRPVDISAIEGEAAAVLVSFHAGTMAGPALADILSGDFSPSGRLPVTWPANQGQIPIYYNHKNTGRPANVQDFVPIDELPQGVRQTSLGFTSGYMDVAPVPAHPFGFGLTYGRFEYSAPRLSTDTMAPDGELRIETTLTNTGTRTATETAQLYVRDIEGNVTRPVRELKGFERVTLAPGQSQVVSFTIRANDLAFTGLDMIRASEPGAFQAWIAPDAESGEAAKFELTEACCGE
jgi:beta-glucosidase